SCMRERKPCVRLRRTLLGWKVLFMAVFLRAATRAQRRNDRGFYLCYGAGRKSCDNRWISAACCARACGPRVTPSPRYAMESLIVAESLWQSCLLLIAHRLPENDVNLWLRPLEAVFNDARLDLMAPNEVVRDHVEREFRTASANALGELDNVPQ